MHSYWTSQTDRRTNVGSLEQGKPSHRFHNTTIICIPTGLLSLIEEPLLGQLSKENTYANTIIIHHSSGFLSLI